jgi:N-acetylmuramoyl-L-alanine amidase-like
MAQAHHRRTVLKALAGAPLWAASGALQAAPRRVAGLIAQAKALPQISQRIEVISRALMGVRYAAHTLIGGPRRKEQFIMRDDAFDCVTYCEFVLAAARATDVAEFETALRRIRYRNGEIAWRERNHYFADWCRNNVDNGICRFVPIADTVRIDKSSDSEPGLGRRSWALGVLPQQTLLANASKLMTGDIVGFVSRRANLDYSHTGFVAFGRKGELLLRHASSTRRRVIEEPMVRFLRVNGVKYVSVLRPLEPKRYAAACLPLGCTSAV